jgi:hypothetical protein
MSNIRSSDIINRPVETEDAELTIDADGAFKPGRYTFSVVVTDDMGQESEAAQWQVEVRDRPQVNLTGPTVVAINQSIVLTAKQTAGGPIKRYAWSVILG